MGFFGGTERKKRTPAAILRSLKSRLAKRQRAEAKRRQKAKIRSEIEATRKKLRGY